jgi:transcriptional regulator with XRE-family HTH domain
MPPVEDLRSAFGRRIRGLRAGVSQEEIAHRAALHTAYLSHLEHGHQAPTLDVINRLARALNVTVAELFRPLDRPFRRRVRARKPTTR